MTCRELLAIEFPDHLKSTCKGGCEGCPHGYDYADVPEYCESGSTTTDETCTKCWNREADEEAVKRVMGTVDKLIEVGHVNAATVEEIKQIKLKALIGDKKFIQCKFEDSLADVEPYYTEDEPKILDSGDRTEFPSGAVRDMRVGKGRCDLLPLDVVSDCYDDCNISVIFDLLYEFQNTHDTNLLKEVLREFNGFSSWNDMFLEVAKHFEEGAKKYGDNNWQKGIPVHCYIDSAVRHYLKYLRGDKDEPHDRAFCWNILCCIWTVKHIEEGEKDV